MKCLLEPSEIAYQSGVEADSRFFHVELDTGLALNSLDKTVTVAVGANLKTYAFDDIREWASRAGRVGSVAFESVGAGLSVSVRDSENPVWTISMRDRSKREQWFEILTEVFASGSGIPDQAMSSRTQA